MVGVAQAKRWSCMGTTTPKVFDEKLGQIHGRYSLET